MSNYQFGKLWGDVLFKFEGNILLYAPFGKLDYITLPPNAGPIRILYPTQSGLGIDTRYGVFELIGDPTKRDTWRVVLHHSGLRG